MPDLRFGVPLPTAAELPALPRGVVLHWTGGTGRANAVDLGAYHMVVEADGTVRLGRWSVAANMRSIAGGGYAGHTGGWNSYRVGIAAAGMSGYEGPGRVGAHPLTEVQVGRMAEVAAYFCALAGLDPLNPAHLCTHREVWTIHGIRGQRNHQKRDIEHLPFRPDLRPDEVGFYLRELAAGAVGIPEPRPPEVVVPLPVAPDDREDLDLRRR